MKSQAGRRGWQDKRAKQNISMDESSSKSSGLGPDWSVYKCSMGKVPALKHSHTCSATMPLSSHTTSASSRAMPPALDSTSMMDAGA